MKRIYDTTSAAKEVQVSRKTLMRLARLAGVPGFSNLSTSRPKKLFYTLAHVEAIKRFKAKGNE